jgi:hypothetical protein
VGPELVPVRPERRAAITIPVRLFPMAFGMRSLPSVHGARRRQRLRVDVARRRDEVHLSHVGRGVERFIALFGDRVLPHVRLAPAA